MANRTASGYTAVMLIVLSPAKSLDFERSVPALTESEARFPEKTDRLVSALSRMSRRRLQEIMPVSDKLVALNAERYGNFYAQPEKPAIHAYNGDVYTGFEASSLDDEALRFAQDHVRILSGLYGLLRPYDPIRAHRLEMGTKWAPRYKKLTDYWGDRIANELASDAKDIDAPFLLNLASQEYWAAVESHADKLAIPVIAVDFRQMTANGPKFQSFAAKRARGMMARYVCEHRVETLEQLQNFDSDGYSFAGRNGNTLHFTRD